VPSALRATVREAEYAASYRVIAEHLTAFLATEASSQINEYLRMD
jgi:hypothetical protein